MQDIEEWLADRKRAFRKKADDAEEYIQLAQELVSCEQYREDAGIGIRSAEEKKAVNCALAEFVDELLSEFF